MREQMKRETERKKQKELQQYQLFLIEQLNIQMLEQAEREQEFLDCLYRYTGSTMGSNNSLLCPDDILMYSAESNTLISSRGTEIDLNSREGLNQLLTAGAAYKMFDIYEMSDADFRDTVDVITEEMKRQADYRDAYKYCQTDTGRTIAMFAMDASTMTPTGLIINESGEVATVAGKAITEDTFTALFEGLKPGEKIENKTYDAMTEQERFAADVTGVYDQNTDQKVRECTYEEFNPNNLNIREELNKNINLENQNKTSKFEEMKKLYEADPGDVKLTNSMSATDKMNAIYEVENQKQQEQEEIEMTPLSTSKSMRFMS